MRAWYRSNPPFGGLFFAPKAPILFVGRGLLPPASPVVILRERSDSKDLRTEYLRSSW